MPNHPRLEDNENPSRRSIGISRTIRRTTQRALKQCMKSHKLRIPIAKHDLPVRIRPWFFVFTSLIMILLAFLGFTNYARRFPLNDSTLRIRQFQNLQPFNSLTEILHFLCLCTATGVFYFIWDVDESSRRIWIWRNSGVILTLVVCFFFGGLMSEVVQSMLPYKEFQTGDVIANILGSSLGLWAAYHLDRYYRHRREISRLYQPVSQEEDVLLSDSDSEAGTTLGDGARGLPLLPTYMPKKPSKPRSQIRLGDVWDESEEMFGIGDDDDELEESRQTPGATNVQPSYPNVKVIVTPPST